MTVSHPGKTSHRHTNAERRREIDITDSMIHVSFGIGDDHYLIETEFKNAL